MATVVLIACGKKKLARPARAEELYQGQLFKKSLRYAKTLNPKHIFILSAQYGLMGLKKRIRPYNKTLNTMSSEERKDWARKVLAAIEKRADPKKNFFIILAGKNYYRDLRSSLPRHRLPLKHLGIGEQLHYLKTR